MAQDRALETVLHARQLLIPVELGVAGTLWVQAGVIVEEGEEKNLALLVRMGRVRQFGAVHGIALPQVAKVLPLETAIGLWPLLVEELGRGGVAPGELATQGARSDDVFRHRLGGVHAQGLDDGPGRAEGLFPLEGLGPVEGFGRDGPGLAPVISELGLKALEAALLVAALPAGQGGHADGTPAGVRDVVLAGTGALWALLSQQVFASRFVLAPQQGQKGGIPEESNLGVAFFGIDGFRHRLSTSSFSVAPTRSVPAGQAPGKVPNSVGGPLSGRAAASLPDAGQTACGTLQAAGQRLEGLSWGGGQGRRPQKTGWKPLALQPVEQKGEELASREMQPGLPRLDLGVELLGQQPEGVRLLQPAALQGVGAAVQVFRRILGQWGVGRQGQQVAQQSLQQQVAGAVGEGGDPLPYRRAGGSPAAKALHEGSPAEAGQQVERNAVLQPGNDEMAVRVKKVGQQAVGSAANLAVNALDRDSVAANPERRPTPVGAPPDQVAGRLAIRLRTARGEREDADVGVNRIDVSFDETGEVLYNDHVLGTPPLVVGPASCEPQREVSLCLPRLVAIILADASSIKPGGLSCRRCGLSSAITECDHEPLEGRALGEPDHPTWPGSALFRSNATAGKT
jgi:hypothetical protein